MLTSEPSTQIPDLAQDAFIWGLPLVLFDRWMQIGLDRGVPYNRFRMNGVLATPDSNTPGPNVDTVYGFIYLDLTYEPQVIGVPNTDDRYYSIQFQDAYLNTFAYVGRRTTGTKAGQFAITPPSWEGQLPDGVIEVKATSSRVFALVRVLLQGANDLKVVHNLMTSFASGPLSQFPRGQVNAELDDDITKNFPYTEVAVDGARFFEDLDRLVRMHPPLERDQPNLDRLAPLGIGSAEPVSRDSDYDAMLAEAARCGFETVKKGIEITTPNGWMRRANVPSFYRDPIQRGANNYFMYATLIAEEGIYFGSRQGGVGQFLDGKHRYRLRFAAGQLPPVDAFWSITLYKKNYLLFDNPLRRYAILDRTKGLKYGADGSLEIQIQADEPAEGPANWLPSPRDEFQLMVRCYQPRSEVIDGSYVPPAVEIV